MTSFLSGHRYNSNLHSPTGQNILRFSPLHALELFQPLVIVNVSHGRVGKDGTSKYNTAECAVAYNFLMESRQSAVPSRDATPPRPSPSTPSIRRPLYDGLARPAAARRRCGVHSPSREHCPRRHLDPWRCPCRWRGAIPAVAEATS